MTRSISNLQQLYEEDYTLWLDATVEKLRSSNYNEVDWNNLIEEIEDIERREGQSLESNLVVVLLHLLKWQF